MFLRLLNIRRLQTWRVIKEIGIFRFVFLLALLGLLLGFCFQLFQRNQYLSFIAGAACVLLIHSLRKDKRFIRITVRNPQWIFFSEYFTYLLPLLVIIALSAGWLYLAGSIVLIFLIIPLANIPRKTKVSITFTKFLSSYNFEWIAGFRRFPFIIPLYLLSLAMAFLPYVSLIGVWLMLSAFASFYEENESLSMLVVKEYDAAKFLQWKINTQLKSYALFIAPVVLLYGIINYETWYITIAFTIVNLCCFVTIILTKYATYRPGKNVPANAVSMLIIVISNIIFPLALFTIILGITEYTQAKQQLNYYLDDFRS